MRQHVTAVLAHLVSAMSVVLACGCGGYPGSLLGVPFRGQESPTYCAAACVQMWQAYNSPGTPGTPQSVIFQFMGGQ